VSSALSCLPSATTLAAMSRPRRKLTTTGPITGDNNRVVYEQQKHLVDALGNWLHHLSPVRKDAAKRLGCSTTMISKMLNCHCRVPKNAVAKWSRRGRLTPAEKEAVALVAELCQISTEALAFVDPQWMTAVNRLSRKLNALAGMRPLPPKMYNIPKVTRRYSE
jgi:hypothetical protein